MLPEGRVGGYLRALRAGLSALAPHEDFSPLSAADAHLRVLAPDVSGDLLGPAEVHDITGMPSFPWLERARAERRLGGEGRAVSAAELERAAELDARLGARMRQRQELHAELAGVDLIEPVRFRVQLVRLSPEVVVRLTFDHLEPSGTWLRVRVDAAAPPGVERLGAVTVVGTSATAEPGLVHLLARHASTPLIGLHEQLTVALDARVTRLSVSRVGPFWFPGIPVAQGVPEKLGQGLLLHAWRESLDVEVQKRSARDPLRSGPSQALVPRGLGYQSERRFAVHPALEPVLLRWLNASGVRSIVTPLVP